MSQTTKSASIVNGESVYKFEKLPSPNGDSFEELFEKLELSERSTAKKGKVRRNRYTVWDKPEMVIEGWKFNEWDYGKVKLAIDARGLFTHNGRIIIRGYDKFFNIDEQVKTKWDNIEKNTIGPYYVTLKENGCIVFMSGMEDGTLIITSKHSTGPRQDETDVNKNHSYVATKWIEKHLEERGIEKSELAKALYDLDVTGIAELCDDNFEEHVLAYKGSSAGIYLHGLNQNTAKFSSYPIETVGKFAEMYGFLQTEYLKKDNVAELRTFLETCAETGTWKSKEIEGFVVRCKRKEEDNDEVYSDFFFKCKFTEPYLMYRDWREVTKSYINGKSRKDIRITRHKGPTNRYLDFVIPLLDSNSLLCERYSRNHGIIELREQFLDHIGKKGIDLAEEYDPEEQHSDLPPKYVLVPVAVLGCGKTTIGSALSHLAGWGHVQNDEMDVPAKKKKQALVLAAMSSLKDSSVVFFDRNNAAWSERAQIVHDMRERYENLKFIGINFWPDTLSRSELWKVARDRIAKRGDNHSTVQSSVLDSGKIDGILRGFMGRFQPVSIEKEPDSAFEFVIDLDPRDGSRKNTEKIVTAMHTRIPDVVPALFSKEDLDKAVEKGLSYQAKRPNGAGAAKVNGKDKKSPVAYFNIGIQEDIACLVDNFYMQNPSEDASFWVSLKSSGKVNTAFHVTLAHVSGRSSNDKKAYKELSSKFITPEEVKRLKKGVNNRLGNHTANVAIKAIAHNYRVMALEVEIKETGLPCQNMHPHITVGFADGIKAVESNIMLSEAKSVIRDWNVEPSILSNQPICAFL